MARIPIDPLVLFSPSSEELEHISDTLRMIGIQLFGLPSVPEAKRLRYFDYLQSEEWQERRQVALERDKHRCVGCNSPDRLEVHHRTYARLGDEYPEDIYTFCSKCHHKLHDPEGD